MADKKEAKTAGKKQNNAEKKKMLKNAEIKEAAAKKEIKLKQSEEVKKEKTVEKKAGKNEKSAKQDNQFNDPYKIIIYPVSTEKSIRLMEAENKLIFRVSLKSKKSEIKKAIEDLFNVKVLSVKTEITSKGRKRAYIQFSDETPAIDIATQLGMM